jgi:phage terminase large subunit-like protein
MQQNNDQGKALKCMGNTRKQQKSEITSFPFTPIKIIVTV